MKDQFQIKAPKPQGQSIIAEAVAVPAVPTAPPTKNSKPAGYSIIAEAVAVPKPPRG